MVLNSAQKQIFGRLERLCRNARGIQRALVDERADLVEKELDLNVRKTLMENRLFNYGGYQSQGSAAEECRLQIQKLHEQIFDVSSRRTQIDADLGLLSQEFGGQFLLLDRLKEVIGGALNEVTNNTMNILRQS